MLSSTADTMSSLRRSTVDDDRQSRFQLGRDGLFVVTGGQADIPKRNRHHHYGHYRHEEHVSEQDNEPRHGRAPWGRRANRGKPSAPAGDLEDFCITRDFPAEKGRLFAPRGIVDLRAEAFVLSGQKPEQPVGKPQRRDSSNKKAPAIMLTQAIRRMALMPPHLPWKECTVQGSLRHPVFEEPPLQALRDQLHAAVLAGDEFSLLHAVFDNVIPEQRAEVLVPSGRISHSMISMMRRCLFSSCLQKATSG